MFGYERPGTTGHAIYVLKTPEENPDYEGQTKCIGYDAVINGLRYSTLKAKLLAGLPEQWDAPSFERQQAGSTRLYKTESGRFFTVASHKFVVVDEVTARDVFGNHWHRVVSEEEAFGTVIQEA